MHLAERVGEDLAVLADEDLGDFVAPRMEELADPEKELGPLREGSLAPARERAPRRPDGGVHLFGAREVDGSGLAIPVAEF